MTKDHLCRCGHAREAHEHYRSGTECALCDGTCRRFVPVEPSFLRRLADKIGEATRSRN